MPDQLQLRGGTTAQHETFTGASKEVTIDTTKKTAVVHDASTAGGNPLMREDGANSALINGSAAEPALAFAAGDADNGIYSPGADQVAISTNGTERVEWGASEVVFNDGGADYDFRIEGDTEANLFFVDAGNDRVGVGTASPDGLLHLAGSAASLFFEDTASSNTLSRIFKSGSTLSINSRHTTAGNIVFNSENSSGVVSERVRIDSSGRLLVGTNSNINTSIIQAVSTGGAQYTAARFSDNAFGPTINLIKSRGASVGTNTAVQDDDLLGQITFVGANGTDYSNAAAHISTFVDGEPFSSGDTTDLPGRLTFSTTADGESSPTERMRIDSSGNVGIGASTLEGAKLQVSEASSGASASANSDTLFLENNGQAGITIGTPNNTIGQIRFADPENDTAGRISYEHNNDAMAFWVNNSERARIDSAGRLLVGTNTSLATDRLLQVADTSSAAGAEFIRYVDAASSAPVLSLSKSRGTSVGSNVAVSDGDTLGYILFKGANGSGYVNAAWISCEVDGEPNTGGDTTDMPGRLSFSTTPDGSSSASEVMRITSGQSVRIGQFGSSQPASDDVRGCAIDATGFISANNTGGRAIEAGRTEADSVSREVLRWFRNGSLVQTITTTATTVSYPTGSDYRLKENVVDMTGAIDRVKQLSPKRFNFIVEPGVEKDGFIAHELETVVPQAVVGEKDQVDEDGNPVWQGVDHSFMVPLLTGALQEAIAKIETLEQRLSDAGIA